MENIQTAKAPDNGDVFPRFNDDNFDEGNKSMNPFIDEVNDTEADVLDEDERKVPSALPTAKPSFNASPKINQWIQISACDDNNATIINGLQSVVPLNRCISNVDNYQIFQLLDEEGGTINLGYKSYKTMKKCLKKQDKKSEALNSFDPKTDTAEDLGLKPLTFSTLCMNNFKVTPLSSIPPEPNAFGYVESYHDSCDANDLAGYAFIPLNTCLRDDSGMILMNRKNDFFVQYTKLFKVNDVDNFNLQFMKYRSSDGTCTGPKKFSQEAPKFTACVEAVNAVYDPDIPKQNLTRESYGCGNFVKQSIRTPTGDVIGVGGDNSGYFDVSAAASEGVKIDDSPAKKEVIALSTIVGFLGLFLAGILIYWVFNRSVKPKFSRAPTSEGGGANSSNSSVVNGSASKAKKAKKPATDI